MTGVGLGALSVNDRAVAVTSISAEEGVTEIALGVWDGVAVSERLGASLIANALAEAASIATPSMNRRNRMMFSPLDELIMGRYTFHHSAESHGATEADNSHRPKNASYDTRRSNIPTFVMGGRWGWGIIDP